MKLNAVRLLLGLLMIISAMNCANRGNPQGGEKDTDPPVIVKSEPENFSTNFNSNEIEITFNEYVKINNLQSQLIISPPMDTAPQVLPLGGASKSITIKIKDTLQPNTTYAFNFGQSIVDNNEGNPYPYYKYVFSTGDYIDSLSVQGYIEDAIKQTPDDFVSVMLYEVDSSYTDSIVYKSKPKYITNTLDSLTSFSIDNIKAGTYKLIALKDRNSNYLYDQKNDKIGFHEGFVTVPTDSSYVLTLFKEEPNFKAYRPKQEGAKKLFFPYQGDYEAIRLEVLGDLPPDYSYRTMKSNRTDTLIYFYKPQPELDSVQFVVSNGKVADTFNHKYRSLEADSLDIRALVSGTINFEDDFTLEANIPFTGIDSTQIQLIDKDSLNVAYRIAYDSIYNRYQFSIDKEEGQIYNLRFLPNTFQSFFGETNKDTLTYGFRTKMKSEYGKIRVNLINPKYPLIVQLVNVNDEVVYERYTTDSPIVDFYNIAPREYGLRVIFDANGNGKYDSGNYLKGIQPERVSYSPPIEPVRANFDYNINFTLLD